MGMWCTRRSSNTVVRRTKRTSSVMWACCNLACNALTVAALTCILRLTGVSSCAVVTEMSLETYTRLLIDANPEFPIHFLNIYSTEISTHDPGEAGEFGDVEPCPIRIQLLQITSMVKNPWNLLNLPVLKT